MTKNEIIAALEKSDKWVDEKDRHLNFYSIKDNNFYISFAGDNYEYATISDVNDKKYSFITVSKLPFENCNLINSVPMKSGKTYSAIICKLPGITIEVEL